jgi:hypothetical protein
MYKMTSRGGRKKWAYSALILGIISVVLLGLLEPVAGDDAENWDDENDEEAEDDEIGDDDGFNDDFLSNNVVEIDPDHDCRDDAYINCTEAKEKGGCDGNDVLGTREICPVTCGTCELPPRTSVWVEFPCFEYGEDIQVFFTNQSPEPDDFIGIFPSYLDFIEEPEHLERPLLWYTSCGSIHEECRTAMGGLIFGGEGPVEGTYWNDFPLESGKYKAALVRGDERTLLAESQVFTAKARDYSCASECHDLIYTDQPCYEFSDASIHVAYENCAPRKDDHVVVYPDDEESPGKREPLLWLGTCGSRFCDDDTADVNPVEFPLHDAQSKAGGILPPGNYRTFLMKSSEGGLYGRGFAKSASFVVKAEGESCYIDEEDL